MFNFQANSTNMLLTALHYASICSYASKLLLCSKLCQHNSPWPKHKVVVHTATTLTSKRVQWLGSQVGELQHYYVSPGSYLWTQGLHNCVDYAFFLFVGIVEGGGEVMATCFDFWGWD